VDLVGWVSFAINPLNAELNPICYLLALLGAHHIFHVSWLRVKIKYQVPNAWYSLKQILLGNDCRFLSL
jgi:hypothetical protein